MSARFIYALLLLCCGCAPCRHVESSQRDSIRIETVEREVIVRDTVTVEIPLITQEIETEQDSSTLRNRFAESTVLVKSDGNLIHTLETIPQKIMQPSATKVRARDSIIYRERVVTRDVEVERELTRWQNMQIYGFWVLLVMFVLALFLRRFK